VTKAVGTEDSDWTIGCPGLPPTARPRIKGANRITNRIRFQTFGCVCLYVSVACLAFLFWPDGASRHCSSADSLARSLAPVRRACSRKTWKRNSFVVCRCLHSRPHTLCNTASTDGQGPGLVDKRSTSRPSVSRSCTSQQEFACNVKTRGLVNRTASLHADGLPKRSLFVFLCPSWLPPQLAPPEM
jgi:hypothetical protein